MPVTYESWFIVLYEWQACQRTSNDSAWWSSAQILGTENGVKTFLEELRRGEQPRRGRITYRNIRGPFVWSEKDADKMHMRIEIHPEQQQ